MLDSKCSINKSFCFDRNCPEEAHCGTISTDLDIQELLSLGKVQEAENDLMVLSQKKSLKFCFQISLKTITLVILNIPACTSKPRFGFQHTYAYAHTQETYT